MGINIFSGIQFVNIFQGLLKFAVDFKNDKKLFKILIRKLFSLNGVI